MKLNTLLKKVIKRNLIDSYSISVIIISCAVIAFTVYDLSITKQSKATRIIEQKSLRIHSELNEFFKPLQNVMHTIRVQKSIPQIRQLDRGSLNKFLIPIIEEYPQISSVGMAHSSGYELDIVPDSTKGFWFNREIFVDEWGMIERWTKWHKSDQVTLIDSWESPLKVDPRERSWFKGAASVLESDIFWTEPYEYMTGQIGITLSSRYSIENDDEDFYILALDITLNDLSRFSQKLNLTDKDEIYILTKNMDFIVGLPRKYSDLSINYLHKNYLTNPSNFGSNPLLKLLEFDAEQIVSFTVDGVKWWGITSAYSVNSQNSLLIATLIPESDVSARIDRTRNFMIFGFLIVLSLSTLLIKNNDKLVKASNELSQKNNLVIEQKQHLLSEVHHRVKNNLAIMSALLELENMMIDDPETSRILSLIQSRIMSMSAVHEVLYKSDKFNRIQVQEILPGITEYIRRSNPDIIIESKNQVEPVLINVNQALSYALFINEFLNYIRKSGERAPADLVICVGVKNQSELIITEIETNIVLDLSQNESDIGFELIQVLIEQLEADFTKVGTKAGTVWSVSFKMEDKKGITSDKSY